MNLYFRFDECSADRRGVAVTAGELVSMVLSGNGTTGFDARLRLISLLFFAISVSIVIVVANTPLTQDDDPEVDRAALNTIAAAGAVVALAIQVFPWRRYPRDAFLWRPPR